MLSSIVRLLYVTHTVKEKTRVEDHIPDANDFRVDMDNTLGGVTGCHLASAS